MYRVSFLLTLVIGSFASFAMAQNAADCLPIDNALDRLSCYDKAHGRTMETIAEGPSSAWSIRTDKSEFADTTDVYLSVASHDPVSCGFTGSQKLTLLLRCVENTTALIISTHCHVASGFGGYGTVEYRIDDKPTQKRKFSESTNNRSLGLWSGGKSIGIIKSMLGANKLLVRFTPFNENPVTANFPISGLDEAITPLRESCQW